MADWNSLTIEEKALDLLREANEQLYALYSKMDENEKIISTNLRCNILDLFDLKESK